MTNYAKIDQEIKNIFENADFIEGDIREYVHQAIDEGKAEERERILEVLDGIELRDNLNIEWRDWKHIRNTIVDSYIKTTNQ